MVRQIEYILGQFSKEEEKQEESRSDEEENFDNEEEDEEYSEFEELEIDQDIVTRGMTTGEVLLSSEFAQVTQGDEPKLPIQLENIQQAEESESQTELKGKRTHTPLKYPQYNMAQGERKEPTGESKKQEKFPSGMLSRDKIPRTPIPSEKLEQAKKENELIRKNAFYVHLNEEANPKKQKVKHAHARIESVPEERKETFVIKKEDAALVFNF